ncbi:MAG: hypothetical protein DWB45_00965 [Xanthomonadales bacterium]|nr:hypothetical protein [Xanthomonadales bacterium]MCC6596712.1 hypothetical protein [Rhodanobacteraceae bacterium]MDL1868165.1 hypothetical protein [Gammaproteobacteria bacterium PRO6]
MAEPNPTHAQRRARVRCRLLAWLVGACVVASPALARELDVQEAIAQAQQQTQGKVLAVQTLRVGKRKIYRIKILTPAGQVRIVQIAAEQ